MKRALQIRPPREKAFLERDFDQTFRHHENTRPLTALLCLQTRSKQEILRGLYNETQDALRVWGSV